MPTHYEQAPPPGPHSPHQDDKVIGRALRWSVIVLLILGVIIIAVHGTQRVAVRAPLTTDAPAHAKTVQEVSPPLVSFADITTEVGIQLLHTNGARGDRLLPETLGSGAAFLDFDNDGDLDLLPVNSTLWPDRREAGAGEPTQALHRNLGDGRFEGVGAARLLRNDQTLGHDWLRVRLQGDGKGVNRDAVGAWVDVLSGDLVQRRQVMPTRSFLSPVELPLTFGLGARTRVDEVRVRSPDVSVQQLSQPAMDTRLLIQRQGVPA